MNTWVAVGDQENWVSGFENGIWGLVPKLENHWKRLQSGDMVLFYCKAPIKGFIGAGIIRSKFKQTAPYWKEELEENRIIWPFRFEFDLIHLIPHNQWQAQAISNGEYNLAKLAGLNPVADEKKALAILEQLQMVTEKSVSFNKNISAQIAEIGKIQRMVVELGYHVDNQLLDVIWKRTIRSVPTFGFAVNLRDDIENSLIPLKHAHDLWNTRPFIVTTKERKKDVIDVSSGLFHDFSPSLQVLDTVQIDELYQSKKRYFELEEKYGLR
ncbi:hypothetical protein JXO52_05375 [bacterium]|nr:hypothetical protein [bacterium]